MNEQELCQKKLIDLSKQANRKGIVLFSDFLNLNELNIYHQSEKLFETNTEAFGGVDYAERQIIAFIPDALYYEWNYPIAVLKVEPVYPKFAEKLGHRDILGALMKLGVDRGKIGDLILTDKEYYIICEETIAPYFISNLDKIKHTIVRLSLSAFTDSNIAPNLEDKDGIISSNRIDNIIAQIYRLSRSKTGELIHAEKVFVNGKSCQNLTYRCKPDDIVSVRGFGRFIFKNEYGATNKGRIKFRYQLYSEP